MSEPKPLWLRIFITMIVALILAAVVAFLSFAVIAWSGQALDPAAPGDQYLFLGFVGGAIFGGSTFFITLVLAWMRSKMNK